MSLLDEPGDLAATPLAAVLLEALNARATGVLEVAHGGGTSRLWFRDGRPVGAQVFAGFKPLGLMLLQAGRIDIDALSRSLARMAETRRPQGELLVEMGAVSAEDVGRALAEQQAGYFSLIAALDAGAFVFDASTPVPAWTRGSKLSPLRTIVDTLERPQASALVASALQPVAAGGVQLAASYRDVADAARWGDAERALVERLRTPATLETFFAESAVAPERARAMLAALLLLGLAAPAADAVPPPAADLVDLAPEAETPPPASRPTSSGASTANPTANPATGRRSDPADARARRQRLLQQAMRNMGVGPFAGASEGRARPREDAGGRATLPKPPAAQPIATSAEAQLRDALLAIAPRARERSLFVRLGIAETAGRDEVKKAFLGLARQFHPDRFASPALADLADTVRDFFAAVNEAYEVLSDDRRRAEYLAERKGKLAVSAEAARVDFLKGEACLRTRDFQRARGFLESAVRADRRAEYLAALAQACFGDSQRRDLARARELLAEARRDATCDRALYAAGLLARVEDDDASAERHLRAAVKLNPRNADAARELRLLEARRADKRR